MATTDIPMSTATLFKRFQNLSCRLRVENESNAANVDMKFYAFGGKAVLRMYSIDGGTGTKSNEFKGRMENRYWTCLSRMRPDY